MSTAWRRLPLEHVFFCFGKFHGSGWLLDGCSKVARRLLDDVSNLHSLIYNVVDTEPFAELVYWGFIVLPLLIVSDWALKLFGVLIFASIFLTWLTYSAPLNSLWCFYCAVLSIVVLWIVNRPPLPSASPC
ncbi:MAG: hypothetical protein ACO23P_01620 [Vulcanococcus sp.]